MAAGGAADADPRGILPGADRPVPGRELLRLRPDRDLPGLHARQLPGATDQRGDLAALYEHLEVRSDRLGHHARPRLQHRLFPGLPCAQRHDARGAVPALRDPVPHLGDHPHHRLDPVPGSQWRVQPGADGAAADHAAPRLPAVLRLRRDRHLRPSLHRADDRPDRQLAVQDRSASAGGGARRRRQPLADHGERRHSAGEDRHRARLDPGRYAGDGRLLCGAPDERRPERVDRLGALDRDPGDAISAGRRQRDGARRRGRGHRGLHDACCRRAQRAGQIGEGGHGGRGRRERRGAAMDVLRSCHSVRGFPRVSLRADAGDLRAVVPRTDRRRHLSDGRGLHQLVRRHIQAWADGEHPGLVLTLACTRRGRERGDGRDVGRGRARLPPTVPGSGGAVLSRGRELGHAEPPGRLRYRSRIPFPGAGARLVHVGAGGSAHLDLAVRAVRNVRGCQPLRPVLGRGRERSRREPLATAAPRDPAHSRARHPGRRGVGVHALL